MQENNEKNELGTLDTDEILSAEKMAPQVDEIEKLIEEKKYKYLKEAALDITPVDLADIMWDLPQNAADILFRLLPKELAAEVFAEMDQDLQMKLIERFSDAELSSVLSELYLDDTVDMIEEMPAGVVKRILRASTPENRSIINELLKYPSGSAGSLMTTEYVRLKDEMTVKDALEHIRRYGTDKETVYNAYVTDQQRRLTGVVTARALLLSDESKTVGELKEENVIFATTSEDGVEVSRKLEKYGFIALPVVDDERRLVGIITFDDAVELINTETEADFAKMAAITPTELPYLKENPISLFLARIPWLLLLMVSATLSSTILSRFEAALIPALVLFVPMLMDTGGNSGSQSSVTITRGLSNGEIAMSDILRVLGKEISTGALCGVSLGIVAFAKVMLVDRLVMGNPAITVWVALAVAISLAATVVVAKTVGSSLPILAKRIGLDPAVMASPIITTTVDAISLVLYFLISANVFGLTII